MLDFVIAMVFGGVFYLFIWLSFKWVKILFETLLEEKLNIPNEKRLAYDAILSKVCWYVFLAGISFLAIVEFLFF